MQAEFYCFLSHALTPHKMVQDSIGITESLYVPDNRYIANYNKFEKTNKKLYMVLTIV